MTMILLLLLAISSGSCIEIEVDLECSTCVILNNICYNVTHLLDLEAPFRNRVVIHKMGVLKSQNILFFSFEPKIEDEEYYKIGFVKLNKLETFGIISGGPRFVVNFGTFDINQEKGLVYFGGSDGVFVLNTTTNKLSPFSSWGDTITTVFFRNYVYFVRYDYNGIVVKRGDNFKTLFEFIPIKNFVVTKNDVIVFLSKYGLYVGKGTSTHRVSGNPFFRGLCVDLNGVVYAWWIDGIYSVVIYEKKLHLSKVVKVSHLPSIGSMTFDNDNNILFTMDRSLFRMTKTTYNCSLN